jgi:AcrR family transcriptional regulator
MKTSKTRTRNARGEGLQLRRDIVQAATELIDAGGGEASVTLRNVAREVGISAPSIYAHFADRDEILLAVLTEAFTELKAQLQTAMAQPNTNAGTRLHATCAAYLEFAMRYPKRYHILFGGIWNAKTKALSLAEATGSEVVGMDVFLLLVNTLQDCVASGISASTDPTTDAAGLWVALHGLAQLQSNIPNMPWSAGFLERLVNHLALLKPLA